MTDNNTAPGGRYQPEGDSFSDLMDNMDSILADMETSSQQAVDAGSDLEFEYMAHADAAHLTLNSGMYIEARIANLLSVSENEIYAPAVRRDAARKAAAMLGINPAGVPDA